MKQSRQTSSQNAAQECSILKRVLHISLFNPQRDLEKNSNFRPLVQFYLRWIGKNIIKDSYFSHSSLFGLFECEDSSAL